MILGVSKILGATAGALSLPVPGEGALLAVSAALSAALAVPVGMAVIRARGT
jgi:hypothetical protein